MKNWTNLYFQETLDKNRLDLLPKLKFLKDLGFYLAGGTSLALQFWHRQSFDFDFFIDKDIDTDKLFKLILERLSWMEVKKTFEEKNTLYIEINAIKLSFFSYNYELLNPIIETDFLSLASFEDIWAMKLWAIQNRATNKDYVDLYYILQKISLKKLIDNFYKKFSNWIISENYLLKSIVYFEDIVEEKLIMNFPLSFKEVKEWLIKIINNKLTNILI